MNTLIFDIDSTICPAKKEYEKYENLIPYQEMIDKMWQYKESGFKIVLFTSRNMRTYDGDLSKILKYTKPLLESWLKKWNIPYDDVIYGKPWPGKDGFYIDDRAVRPKEFLEKDIDSLSKICDIDKNI